jgi:signal peptidase I
VTELNLRAASNEPNTTADQSKRPQSVSRKVVVAGALSLLVPGLGQVYDKRPWRGLGFALSLTVVVFLAGESRLWMRFIGLVSFLLVSILLRLYIAADAGYLATTEKQIRVNKPRVSSMLNATATISVLLLGVYPGPDYLMRRFSYFHAFKVTSASMCPTICEGDRIVANMDAFIESGPGRADVIMMKHEASDALFIKRIIGVEGDSISTTEGHILVNGQPLAKPRAPRGCGNTAGSSSTKEEPVFFDPVEVPTSSFFVVGDNLPNSYDSRIQGFGFVTASQVRGRPLFIYWSPISSRIGCPIR